MALTKDEVFLYKEVITKVKREHLLNKFIIPIDAYLPLGLNSKQLRLLEKICQDNNIELEKLPPQMKHTEADKLLLEYHQIKEQIENNPEQKNIESLKKQQAKLKEKIALGHMVIVYKLINRKLPNLEEEKDREDIYQTGYMILLEFIDSYNPYYKMPFDRYLRNYLIPNLLRKMIMTNRGLNTSESDYVKKVNNAKRKLNPQENDVNINEKIAEMTGFSVEKVEYLLLLSDISRIVSLEELSKDTLKEVMVDPYNIDEDLEQKLLSEKIIKLLDTLKPEQKEVIMLYYGLKDGKRYTHEEIAKILGYNHHQNSRNLKYAALKTLSLHIYKMYLNDEYSETYDIEEYLHTEKELSEQKRIKELEIYLLEQLPEHLLKKLISKIREPEKQVLLMMFGIENGIKYTEEEIAKIINKSISTVKIIKVKAIKELRFIIKQEILHDNHDSRYFNYIGQYYLSKNTKKMNYKFISFFSLLIL